MSFKTDGLLTKKLPAVSPGNTVATAGGEELTLEHAQRLTSDRAFIQVAFPDLTADILPDGETLTVEIEQSVDGGAAVTVHTEVLTGDAGLGSRTNYCEFSPYNSKGNIFDREDVILTFTANVIASAGVVAPVETPVLRYVTY